MVTQQFSTSTRWSLAMLAGLLNGVGFIFWGPASLVANVPLLLALRDSRSPTESAMMGALVGFIGGVHIYGVLKYGWFLLAGFSLYTASQMIIYALIIHSLWNRGRTAFDLILPALAWTLTEWLRTIGPMSMPASYVGNLADTDILRSWLYLAPITGGLGVSSLVALSQSVIFHGVFGKPTHRRAAGWVCGLMIMISVGATLIPPDLGEQTVSIAGVQGGLANSQYAAAKADVSAQRDVIHTYAELSRQAYETGADWVLWPETAVRAPVLRTAALRKRLFPAPTDSSTLIAGLITHDEHGRRFNSAVAVGPGMEIKGVYRKNRLVPGAESHFSPGSSWMPLSTDHGRLGVMICLESVYPDSARALVSSGAQALAVLSNDAGFGWSPITLHMTNRAKVRALETGRWLVRVGQAGITSIIDPRGQEHGRLGLFVPEVLSGEIRLRDDETPYVRWGDWWAFLTVFSLVLLGFLSFRSGDARG